MRASRSTRIAEVAAHAGVSPGTASDALSGKAGSRISAETRLRIERSARELNYHGNRLARSMRTGKSGIVGLMVSSGRSNPFMADLLYALEQELAKAGYEVIVDTDWPFRHSNRFMAFPVEGVLMWAMPNMTAEEFIGPSARNVPIIYLGYPRTDASTYIANDVLGGARAAMDHLLSKGYRRIAYAPTIADAAQLNYDDKYMAYCETCERLGVPVNIVRLEPEDADVDASRFGLRTAGFRAGVELGKLPLAERPDAIFCSSDVLASGIIQGLVRSGLRVPEDVGIVGYDNIEEAHCLSKTLTTVSYDVPELVRLGVAALVRRIQDDEIEHEHVTIPTFLVPGETT
ncbi:MAG: LacI family DNA-binding transcriptional regulator [Capsulimonadaceae bacterium]|nr:LacI family DNA-binding transcriptional regulator [Capsulimonadaceae bacterium]